jgi:uncharacterized zinc-type alcohol dehydrogenase-like protein
MAASAARGKLEPFTYDPGPLGDEQVEIEVKYCGICHSDIVMLNDELKNTRFPFVPGHEAVGTVAAAGRGVKLVSVGQTVGLGWNSSSCMACPQCLAGDHNLCRNLEMTIVGRQGAFATRVRCHWVWATPIPQGLDVAVAGPLFCAGITVFNPLVEHNVKPSDRVGVIGIGGLGHLALQFMNKWGCEVTAFTSSGSKADEAKRLGAHHAVDTHSAAEVAKLAGSFDFILSTVSAPLDWSAYINALAPKGHLHVVGVVAEPMPISAVSLFLQQRSVGGTPSGPPRTVATMLDFCVRHGVHPVTEEFPMSRVNDALAHMEAGKARYRIVLKNDL